MKKKNLFAVALVCLSLSPITSMADDLPIPPEQLPANAKAFVAKEFPGQSIVYAERDHDGRVMYETHLSDGTKVDFTRTGEWDKVDTNCMKAVPANLVPAPIKQYVQSTFAGAVITKIDKERYGYEVELSNGLDLKFNKAGAFMRIDD